MNPDRQFFTREVVDRRSVERRTLSFAGQVREGCGETNWMVIDDLSIDGCHIAGDLHLEQATEVWLRIPGLTPRPARIAWSRPGEAGCEFITPVSEEQVGQIARNSVATERAEPRARPTLAPRYRFASGAPRAS
jgi:hypothetical protein